MPGVVQVLVSLPHQAPSEVHQTKGHIVGAADMTQIRQVFVRTPDGYNVFAPPAHTSAVVSSVHGVDFVQNALGLAVHIVDATLTHDPFKGRIVEGIKIATDV